MSHSQSTRSADRIWEKHVIRIDGRPLAARKATCSTEGCGQQGEILDRSENGLPGLVIRRRFEAKGWEIGANEKHDFCPLLRREAHRRAPSQASRSDTTDYRAAATGRTGAASARCRLSP